MLNSLFPAPPQRKKCPRCGTEVEQLEAKLYRCDRCKMLTDCQDDGDIGYRSQERYAERKEEFQLRQREREKKRLDQQSRLIDRYGDRRRGR